MLKKIALLVGFLVFSNIAFAGPGAPVTGRIVQFNSGEFLNNNGFIIAISNPTLSQACAGPASIFVTFKEANFADAAGYKRVFDMIKMAFIWEKTVTIYLADEYDCSSAHMITLY